MGCFSELAQELDYWTGSQVMAKELTNELAEVKGCEVDSGAGTQRAVTVLPFH